MAESKEHKDLKNRALQYLWNKNYWISKVEKECGYYGIYDAWGISKLTFYTMGIEVKVSRADFKKAHRYKNRKLRRGIDDELQRIHNRYEETGYNYIDTIRWGGANENYYICPSGLIQPEETGVYGLLWFNGKRLVNKKKPAFIKVHIKDKLEQVIGFLEPKFKNEQV